MHSHPGASLHLSFSRSLSPRPSAPTSPPNCCLMMRLLCNTLEHRLRDQDSYNGFLSLLNQKRREGHINKVLQRSTLIWIIVRNTSLGVCYPGCFPLSLFCVRRLRGLGLSAGSPSLVFIPSSSAVSNLPLYSID